MTELQVGDFPPDFVLPVAGGGSVDLAALRGKSIVLYFYPKDDTAGCTAEAVAFTEMLPEFESAGAVIIGISPDPVARHDKFVTKHGLKIILASDEDHHVSEAYGVWREKSMYGRTFMGIERSTFLVGPDGRLRAIWRKVKVAGHAGNVLVTLKS